MFATEFEYKKANSVSEAIQLLSNDADAKLMAGGHSLIPLMKLRLARPGTVIDIGGIAELQGITANNGILRIGALTTHAQLAESPLVRDSARILWETAYGIGDPQVRNRGTIGGNVSHADPASDLPTVLVAMDAKFTIQGQGGITRRGSRTVAAADFFTGAFSTVLAENEILTAIEMPVLAANQHSEYAKMAHPATSYAVVGAAAVVTMDGNTCTVARVAVGGLTPSPVRGQSVEQALVGQELNAETIAAAANLIDNDLGSDIIGDIFASAEYRRAMAAIELKHAIFHATGLAHH